MHFRRARFVAAKFWPELCHSRQFRFRQVLSQVPELCVPIRFSLDKFHSHHFVLGAVPNLAVDSFVAAQYFARKVHAA
jgi:hypothetical protein